MASLYSWLVHILVRGSGIGRDSEDKEERIGIVSILHCQSHHRQTRWYLLSASYEFQDGAEISLRQKFYLHFLGHRCHGGAGRANTKRIVFLNFFLIGRRRKGLDGWLEGSLLRKSIA